jgi:hypothetical protein
VGSGRKPVLAAPGQGAVRVLGAQRGAAVDLPDNDRIDSTLGIYFHPVGTCAVGSLPSIPRANTHLTTLAIAEKLAETI